MLPLIILNALQDMRSVIKGKYSGFEKRCLYNYTKYMLKSCFMDDNGVAKFNGRTIQYLNKDMFYCLLFELYRQLEYNISLGTYEPLILDCGSNIGMSIIFFKELYPYATVVGFEPDPLTFSILEKNTGTLDKVELHNVALSDEVGYLPFFVDSDSPGSLCQNLFTSSTLQSSKITQVKVELLSDHIKRLGRRVNLLKVDIEGAEQEVFDDLYNTGILAMVDNIICEFHFNLREHSQENLERLQGILTRSGFRYRIMSVPNNLYLVLYAHRGYV